MGLGVFGRRLRSGLAGAGSGARGMTAVAKATAMQGLEVGLSAGLLSFLAAYSRARGVSLGPVLKDGNLLGVPFSLAGAVIAGVGALATRGNKHWMNFAVGGLAAYLTTAGIKLGYRGTTLTPAISGGGIPGYGSPYALPNYANYGYGYYGVGATPETESLFQAAGV